MSPRTRERRRVRTDGFMTDAGAAVIFACPLAPSPFSSFSGRGDVVFDGSGSTSAATAISFYHHPGLAAQLDARVTTPENPFRVAASLLLAYVAHPFGGRSCPRA